MRKTSKYLAVACALMLAASFGASAAQAREGGGRVTSSGSTVWYLAEGSTGDSPQGYFETFILVSNPGATSVHVKLWHQLDRQNTLYDGSWQGAEFDVPALSRYTVNVADTLNTGAPSPVHEWSVSTRVEASAPVFAQGSVYWTDKAVVAAGGMTRQASSESVAVREPATNWYLAEGSASLTTTAVGPYGFETWVLVQNPGTTSADVSISYQTPTRDVAGPSFRLAANTRRSISIGDTLPGEDSVATTVTSTVPVVTVKSMYFTSLDEYNKPVPRISAHGAAGATDAQTTWWLPMGKLAGDIAEIYNTYVLVQNPGDETATAHVDFIGETAGMVTGYTLTLAPRTRQTVDVGRMEGDDAVFNALSGHWFATIVRCDTPVVAEKAVYYTHPGHITMTTQWVSGFGSLGTTELGRSWAIPEGSTAIAPQGTFSTLIGVANPTTSAVNVSIDYSTTGSVMTAPTFTLEPQSFRVVRVSDTVPNQWSVSTAITADGDIAAEGVLYWDAQSPAFNFTMGNPGTQSATTCVGQPQD